MLYLITLKDLSIHLLGLPYGPICFSKISICGSNVGFSDFPEDRTCSFLVFVHLSFAYKKLRRCCQCFPSKQWCGRSCVGEPHEKRLGAEWHSPKCGGGWWIGQASKKRIFYVFHTQKCSCVGNPPFVGMNLQNNDLKWIYSWSWGKSSRNLSEEISQTKMLLRFKIGMIP